MLNWNHYQALGEALFDLYPEEHPLKVRFSDLHARVLALEDFGGDPTANEVGIFPSLIGLHAMPSNSAGILERAGAGWWRLGWAAILLPFHAAQARNSRAIRGAILRNSLTAHPLPRGAGLRVRVASVRASCSRVPLAAAPGPARAADVVLLWKDFEWRLPRLAAALGALARLLRSPRAFRPA